MEERKDWQFTPSTVLVPFHPQPEVTPEVAHEVAPEVAPEHEVNFRLFFSL